MWKKEKHTQIILFYSFLLIRVRDTQQLDRVPSRTKEGRRFLIDCSLCVNAIIQNVSSKNKSHTQPSPQKISIQPSHSHDENRSQ